MTADDSPFEFSAAWHALGVATPARVAALRAEWDRGEDRNPEHYRWRAFLEFVAEQPRPLAPDVVAALYRIGVEDADRAVGAAMMQRVVELPECPEHVLAAAAASGQRHLVRAVERRRAAI